MVPEQFRGRLLFFCYMTGMGPAHPSGIGWTGCRGRSWPWTWPETVARSAT